MMSIDWETAGKSFQGFSIDNVSIDAVIGRVNEGTLLKLNAGYKTSTDVSFGMRSFEKMTK